MQELLANAASTTVALAASATDTTLNVVSVAAFPVPDPATPSLVRVVATDPSSGAVLEYLSCTHTSGNSWTVVRANEDPVRFPAVALPVGTVISQVVTAFGLQKIDGYLATFRLEVSTSIVLTIPAGAFTTIQVGTTASNSRVIVDPSGLWDQTNYVYTVPFTGLYDMSATIRLADGLAAGLGYGIGIHTSDADGPWFAWGATAGTEVTTRTTVTYIRRASFNKGDKLRLYMYVNSSKDYSASSLFICPLQLQ